MIKLLYISPNDPSYYNGGAIGTKKYIEAFQELIKEKKIELYTVNSTEKFQKSSYNNIKIRRTKIKAILSRVLGYSDQIELSKEKILELLKKNKIDKVIIQSSRLGNIAQTIKKKYPGIEIIQNFDNFEYRFSEMYTAKMNDLIRKIELVNIKKSEKKALEVSDKAVFLTKKDKEEVFHFYGLSKEYEIIPIVYTTEDVNNKNFKTENQIIFTGSLDMEANIEAAIFLINNIVQLFNENKELSLIIAGRNPDIRIFEALNTNINKNRIKIISNPNHQEMSNELLKSLMYVSPVFQGSGMKTKFIEAMNYGLPIIASSHTMIGYDWFDLENENFIKIFKDYSSQEMLDQINYIFEIRNSIQRKQIVEFYDKNFSKDEIIQKIKKMIVG